LSNQISSDPRVRSEEVHFELTLLKSSVLDRGRSL
jgi:hypothetical protein